MRQQQRALVAGPIGVLAAALSSTVGGITTAVTRFTIGATDPVTLAALRFGLGFLLLLPIALALNRRWPGRGDACRAALLGLLFFALFFGLFNLALEYTSAAHGALALSVLPLMTMLVGAALGIEPLGRRKAAGVVVATAGVAIALAGGRHGAPAAAWRGDLVMLGATLCFALYTLWSRPVIARIGPLPFVTVGMGAGAAATTMLAWSSGGLAAVAGFGRPQWAAILYLGIVGGAFTFFLWVFALTRTTPTRVANTITLNPVTAAVAAAILLGEPIGLDLAVGVAGVFAGIWLASTEARPRNAPLNPADWSPRMLRDIGLPPEALGEPVDHPRFLDQGRLPR